MEWLNAKPEKDDDMIQEGNRIIFTQTDKENTSIKTYTDEELATQLDKYEKKARPRRIAFLIAFAGCLIAAAACDFEPYHFISCIASVFFAACCMISELLYRLNRKPAALKTYVEIRVDKINDVETHYSTSATTGPESIQFYPIEGQDTTTNYQSTWYLDKETYRNTNVGDIVQIKVPNE